MVKIISWNVNGMRSILKKDSFYPLIESESPDIICIQEVRATPEQVKLSEAFNKEYSFQVFNNPDTKKGYSGTAIFSKVKPIRFFKGIGIPEHDTEGRVLTIEFETYFIVNVYVPNSKTGLLRLEYRVNEWDSSFNNYLNNLEIEKPVVVCGDFNTICSELDIHNTKIIRSDNSPGATSMEINSFKNNFLKTFVDSFRIKNPEKIKYSWWSNLGKSRQSNKGWRIDYFLVSKELKFEDSDILDQVMGSDHAPCIFIF